MSELRLVGIGPGAALDDEARQLVGGCCCVVVSSRHRPLVAELGIEILPIAPVGEALAAIEARLAQGDVAVLASGDPLFFGIGRTLIARFGSERLTVRPALSSLQLACSRFKVPWDDLRCLSLHGRDGGDLARRLMAHDQVFCFTDRINSPDRVARALLDRCQAMADQQLAWDYRIWVAENLGLADERLTQGSLAEIAAGSFTDLNVMLLARPARPAATEVLFGLAEAEIQHSRGLITKNEVRAASLHALRLPRRGVLWDVGAGSGSVGLEAARLCPELAVYAVERNPEELANIRANCRAYGVVNLIVVAGEAPAALAELPAPDRVFVGGSGGRLAEIIATAAPRLSEGGRLVVNGVIASTKNEAPALLHTQGLAVTISEIAVQRRRYPQEDIIKMNSIAIMVGER